MSISSVGSYGASDLAALLATLQSRMQSAQQARPPSTTDPSAPTNANNQLTGSCTPQLSSQILAMLVGLQQQSASGGQSSQSATDSTDPLQQLFSAMDTNADGSVSPSEMEGYIENLGGTQNQADALYSTLDQNGSGSLTEAQLASAAPPQPQGHTHHRHHHHLDGAGDSSQAQATALGNTLVQLMDTDGDGSVSGSEFDAFVTQNGGTSDQANADFAALDPTDSGSIGASDFASAIENLQSGSANGTFSPAMTLLDAFAQNAQATSATTSVTA